MISHATPPEFAREVEGASRGERHPFPARESAEHEHYSIASQSSVRGVTVGWF